MFLRYVLPNGDQKEIKLRKDPATIGRGTDVDISIPDKLASRVHCGISFWDDAYFLRDFKSKNGTFVNERRVDVVRLKPGNRIRIGDTIILVDAYQRKGADTVMKEINEEMAGGKGYHTILMNIIEEEKEK